mmetsp:Transcript_36699/g.91449  ORF Transcript_36699/g.91449 Transcript_36699/m.91449 type:complete len:365 (+) Transcript_36699:92-1186(+)
MDPPRPCTALSYPRTLRGVLDDGERAHLTKFFFERVRGGRSSLTYYHLLRHLASEQDEAGWRIVQRVAERVRVELGEGFTLLNDFFSLRTPGLRLFPSWHQDGEFWIGDDGSSADACTGFNLWILLDHVGMNYSFDVLEVERNAWAYDDLYARQYGLSDGRLAPPRPLFSPGEFATLSRKGSNSLRGFFKPGEQRVSRLESTNVPLESGDALLLRQVEMHRTDTRPLQPGEWRLALGFKVLRSRVLLREQNPNSPFGDDSSQVRLSWPGLLPDFTKGETVPFVYNQTRLRLLDPRLQRPPWLAWLLSDMGCALAGAFLFAVVAVGFALGAPRARRAGGRRRGRGEDECLGLPLPGARGRRRADD